MKKRPCFIPGKKHLCPGNQVSGKEIRKKGTAQYDPVIYTPESFKPGFLCVFRLPSNPAPERKAGFRTDKKQQKCYYNIIIRRFVRQPTVPIIQKTIS